MSTLQAARDYIAAEQRGIYRGTGSGPAFHALFMALQGKGIHPGRRVTFGRKLAEIARAHVHKHIPHDYGQYCDCIKCERGIDLDHVL